MSMLYIGVDIGGTATKYGVFTVEGKLISKWRLPLRWGSMGAGSCRQWPGSLRPGLRPMGMPWSRLPG